MDGSAPLRIGKISFSGAVGPCKLVLAWKILDRNLLSIFLFNAPRLTLNECGTRLVNASTPGHRTVERSSILKLEFCVDITEEELHNIVRAEIKVMEEVIFSDTYFRLVVLGRLLEVVMFSDLEEEESDLSISVFTVLSF
mmetsp:Transcript_16260/g.25297  ORF Transcript_16260/g.25297 Transcript_16260/m.25297 type:complete len:140 (+) Transcript_16260:2024-2443(+)